MLELFINATFDVIRRLLHIARLREIREDLVLGLF